MTPSVPVSSPALSPARLLVSGALGFALLGAIPALYGVALPEFTRRFDLADGSAGWLLSIHGLGAFLMVTIGVVGPRWMTMRLSFVLLAFGAAIVAAAPVWPLVLLGGLVEGAGFGLMSLIVNRRFLSEFRERGPGMVGLVNAIYGIGAVFSPLLFIWLGGAQGAVLWGIAVLSLCLIPVVQPSGRGLAGAGGLPDLAHWRMGILSFIFVGVVVEVSLFGLGPTALIAQGIEELTAARLSSGFFATFLTGRLALYWLTRRVAPERLFLAANAGSALCILFAATVSPSVGLVVSGLFVGATFPVFYVWATRILGDDPRLSSAIFVASLGGATFGFASIQTLIQAVGTQALFGVLAALSTMTTLAVALTLTLLRPQAGPPGA